MTNNTETNDVIKTTTNGLDDNNNNDSDWKSKTKNTTKR